MTSVYDFSAPTINGQDVNLDQYRGKVLLIVNTASKCGFTPQYKGLQALHEKYKDQGLQILGFPCNQFGKQEQGNESQISEFCELNYGVDFQMFSKIDVNGSDAHPLYQHLKQAAPGLLGSKAVKWNFTKFLVNKDGDVVKRYAPTDTPESLEKDVAKLL
ncbi:MAG: glutathione peroxidase [Gammaproteobacteria bacterium]|jgi:glutathione peroxidase|nr:glutathione peroxidase [Gammaproteobacteria bacterium]MBQ0775580.1 glutathione peroxidase [Gammaproteobacteria bacterium]|tara:strand:- start:43975 stop:44454 length:480 start_codon:yes stop_codon:yes gene_type:complete